ncbi:MAG: allophanate hydrolase [Steroidobacteraceae bacterium]
MSNDVVPLLINDLLAGFRSQPNTVTEFYRKLLQRINDSPEHHVWITRLSEAQVFSYVSVLQDRPSELPLYGVPFVIKDNIDLAQIPTTAGCPEFAYTPQQSAFVVQRLIDAGAIPLGKANMDQFATGLVGTRSPYGTGNNSFNPEYISGGSSSGSALAVALGYASFALGTDTAGSGRVPAAFNNLIGLKPSCGRLSTTGLVPACRSIDCISIFALTAVDAATVLHVAQGYDQTDPWSQPLRTSDRVSGMQADTFRVGVPRQEQLQFFDDTEYARLFDIAQRNIESLGGQIIELDFTSLFEAAQLLYTGPWVAERYAAIENFIEQQPHSLHSVTREITMTARNHSAVQTFKAKYHLQALKRAAATLMLQAEVFMTPTAGTIYRIAEIEADPIRLNSNLGYYTNFMNLLDLAAVAVPTGFRNDGLPFGIMLFSERDTDEALLSLADRMQHASVSSLGAMPWGLPTDNHWPDVLPDFVPIVVCGSHMRGLPLNHQLTSRGAYFLQHARTAARYRFYALSGEQSQRPGLVQVESDGVQIEVEVWAMPKSHWGSFIAGIPAPLCLGKVLLQDGESITGFLCEAHAINSARDISVFGGWRGYLSSAQ